jgi:hypothetical protein
MQAKSKAKSSVVHHEFRISEKVVSGWAWAKKCCGNGRILVQSASTKTPENL